MGKSSPALAAAMNPWRAVDQGTLVREFPLALCTIFYPASWLNLPSYGKRPENGLLSALLPDADQETRELLGVAEGLY